MYEMLIGMAKANCHVFWLLLAVYIMYIQSFSKVPSNYWFWILIFTDCLLYNFRLSSILLRKPSR